MKNILLKHNYELKRQAKILLSTIKGKNVTPELIPYKNWLVGILKSRDKRIDRNLENLENIKLIETKLKELPNTVDSSIFDLIPDILSETETIAAHINILSARYISPIHRGLPSDEIGLKLLDWLHKAHEKTYDLPFAISDGSFSILPDYEVPTLYFLPPLDQRGLLYLPLFFHEFGHLLYAIHDRELDDLVKEFQLEIEDLLRPLTIHNDENEERNQQKIKSIIDTWYQWLQEFFCDAVGLVIGGESYLYAFSAYFQTGGITEFYIAEEDLNESTHPITYIRIKLLVKRAIELGYQESADKIMIEWYKLSEQYNNREEYFGYYSDAYEEILYNILSDMLLETSPNIYEKQDPSSPVKILNDAWNEFNENQIGYENWEKKAINKFIEKNYS